MRCALALPDCAHGVIDALVSAVLPSGGILAHLLDRSVGGRARRSAAGLYVFRRAVHTRPGFGVAAVAVCQAGAVVGSAAGGAVGAQVSARRVPAKLHHRLVGDRTAPCAAAECRARRAVLPHARHRVFAGVVRPAVAVVVLRPRGRRGGGKNEKHGTAGKKRAFHGLS